MALFQTTLTCSKRVVLNECLKSFKNVLLQLQFACILFSKFDQ